MRKAVIVNAKFDQNSELRQALLNTGDEYLEEGNTWSDRTWGTVNGSGANLLGKILMEVREEIKEALSCTISTSEKMTQI